MTRKRWVCVVAAVSLLLVSAAAASGCGGESEKGLFATRDEGLRERTGMEGTDLEESVTAEVSDAQGEMAVAGTGTAASTLPQLQLKVIKTALVEMEAGKGDYAKIKRDAVVIITAAGGYVESENAGRDDEGFTYAVLTLRIPAGEFEGAMEEISALGEVVSTQVSTSDVSAEYVDMESRLRHLQAEESFYLGLIGQASTIQEMIAIREHLSSIQLEKERVQGRMNYLDQQVGFSTLTLSVDETGPEDEGKGFWGSIGDAFKSFGRGMGKLTVALFYVLPYLAVLALVFALVWLLVRRLRRKSTAE